MLLKSIVMLLLCLSSAVILFPAAASAQQGMDPAKVVVVPYRLPTVDGGEIEMRIQFKNVYKEVLGADFDITKVMTDGDHVLQLASVEGGKVNLAMKIANNNVLSTKVTTDARPAQGATSVVLSVLSRSGEALYFIFNTSTGAVTFNSSRTGYIPAK